MTKINICSSSRIERKGTTGKFYVYKDKREVIKGNFLTITKKLDGTIVANILNSTLHATDDAATFVAVFYTEMETELNFKRKMYTDIWKYNVTSVDLLPNGKIRIESAEEISW